MMEVRKRMIEVPFMHVNRQLRRKMMHGMFDSGCSNHMTEDESIFYKFDKTVITQITMGNGTVVNSKEK
jgi:hypothetical protein